MILIRHGESEGNSSGIIQGRIDTALSELGRRQARQAAEALAELGLTEVVASPLMRARTTAEVIAARLGLPLSFDDELLEYDHGAISGLTQEQIRERFPVIQPVPWGVGLAADGRWVDIPHAEGREPFFQRVTRALNGIRARPGRVAVVTHGGFINAACHSVLGMDYTGQPHMFRTANCSFTEFGADRQGRWVLKRHNDACHLNVKTTPAEA